MDITMNDNQFAPYEKHEYKSTQTQDLFAALAKAQGEMDNAIMGSKNPFFKSNYASLADIVNTSRPAMAKNGLSIAQPIVIEDGKQVLVTVLAHASGQWIESRMLINPPKTDIQSFGSYVSYLRRYCIAALCGIVTENEDNDGETHMQYERKSYSAEASKDRQPQPITQYITPAQINALKIKIAAHPTAKDKYNDYDFAKIRIDDYQKWLDAMDKK
jgi:hypothetical protein